MISIVLPVYNGEKYLKESIGSILNQTYQDFELIIVNDCSTDNTINIINDFKKKDDRITIINNNLSMKLPASLNIGFEYAKGEYFTWTSDDNIMLPKCLESLYNVIIDKNVDLVFSCVYYIDENGNIINRKKHPKELDEIFSINIIGASFLYKRMIHEKLGGYNENRFLIEDYDFFIRAYNCFRFAYIKDVLYLYRVHKNSLTGQKDEEIKKITIDYYKELLKNENYKKYYNKICKGISYKYRYLSDLYLLKCNKRDILCDIYDRIKFVTRGLLYLCHLRKKF